MQLKENEHTRGIFNAYSNGIWECSTSRLIGGVIEDSRTTDCRKWRMVAKDRNE